MLEIALETARISLGRLHVDNLTAGVFESDSATVADAVVNNRLDVTGANVEGLQLDRGIVGDYDAPALDTTVTLTTGDSPAAVLPWGDFPARAAVDVMMEDPSGTIDEENDIDHSIVPQSGNQNYRAFSFEWVNDPGSDIDINVRVSKFL